VNIKIPKNTEYSPRSLADSPIIPAFSLILSPQNKLPSLKKHISGDNFVINDNATGERQSSPMV
jgi:hypothetical protein